MNYIQSILLGFIEGITEFFPISSTGHMIVAASIMGILKNRITNFFLVSVQFGSILSIVFLYGKKIFYKKIDFYIKIFLASFPVGILGLIFYKKINILLNQPFIVYLSLIIGGIIILKCENFYKKNFYKERNKITYYRAFIIGLFQCISLIPGISRSATTITAGLLQKIDRKDSIEFSFFLSIPVISFATLKKLLDYKIIQSEYLYKDLKLLLLGNIVSFVTSITAIKYLMKYLKKNDFNLFGYYRIIIGFLLMIIHYYYNI
ncbi:undecaprenyl-diphosphate phosphatase [Blattabacterium cuenoti]|uniref:undecaprenyl-diphosphate phosphatase n=1 Tax=Blattabacterium cuenoti TaxID=1653831 RepID=UPI00163CCCC9|nr:undecaprenyl-diphosphate phosphatase [Blattabacterium cuenoti]